MLPRLNLLPRWVPATLLWVQLSWHGEMHVLLLEVRQNQLLWPSRSKHKASKEVSWRYSIERQELARLKAVSGCTYLLRHESKVLFKNLSKLKYSTAKWRDSVPDTRKLHHYPGTIMKSTPGFRYYTPLGQRNKIKKLEGIRVLPLPRTRTTTVHPQLLQFPFRWYSD